MRRSLIYSLLTAIGTLGVTVLIILFAKGYWYNPQTGQVIKTGLLAVNSSPTGASVFIDNKLSDATNTTIKLEPGSYQVKVEKEGYQPWQKEVRIEEEMVTPIYALLIASSPELKPLTLNGVSHPVLSPDGSTLAYTTPAAEEGQRLEQAGIWTLTLSDRRPFGLLGGGKPIQVATDSLKRLFSKALLAWSPNQDRLLAVIPEAADTGEEAPLTQKDLEAWVNDPSLIPKELKASAWLLLTDTEAGRQLPQPVDDLGQLLATWKNNRDFTASTLLSLYPEEIRREATTSADLKFSPDEKRLMYRPPGQDEVTVVWKEFTEVEKRAYGKPEKTFLPLGIKEKESFETTGPVSVRQPHPKEMVALFKLPPAVVYQWLPERDSTHLVMLEPEGISVIEADGQNKVTIYTGEFQEDFLVPWPDGSKLVILTNLNRAAGSPANLYTLSLR